MSAPSEEDLMIREIEQEMKVKPAMCVISKKGLTLFGYNLPWVVVILAVVALFFYLNKQGMLGDSVGAVVTESSPVTTPATTMSGGFRGLNLGNPGQVRQMMGH
jgi:hypothetical protein